MRLSFFSMRAAQEAQVMPPMRSSTDAAAAGRPVEASVLLFWARLMTGGSWSSANPGSACTPHPLYTPYPYAEDTPEGYFLPMGIAVGITMSTKVKVAAFLLALAASFGVAYGIGASVAPLNG